MFIFTNQVNAQAPLRKPANAPPAQHKSDLDPKLLMKAKDVFRLMNIKLPIVADVRSPRAYNEEHIKGSISVPYVFIKEASEESLKKYFPSKEKPIVAYCGCPHHLSGLSAIKLLSLGYKRVKIIDEGYWGWKKMGFPVKEGSQATGNKSSMNINGQILDSKQQPLPFTDIFVAHKKSGQLEATRTDSMGRYQMALHFFDMSDEDQLVFKLEDDTLLKVTHWNKLKALSQSPISLQVPFYQASK